MYQPLQGGGTAAREAAKEERTANSLTPSQTEADAEDRVDHPLQGLKRDERSSESAISCLGSFPCLPRREPTKREDRYHE